MKANNCKLVISVRDGKVDIAAENVSQMDLAEICGLLQVFVGQEAINRGMNIVDVSKLLGHSRVETTMEYITTDSNSVKNNHINCII